MCNMSGSKPFCTMCNTLAHKLESDFSTGKHVRQGEREREYEKGNINLY